MKTCIILTALPGAGKSTLCHNSFPSCIRINQDSLGSRDKCLEAARLALEAGKNIIIDRVNHTAKQRKYWIDLALQFGCDVVGIYLEVPEEECIARIHARKDHETITPDMPLEKKRSIVYNFHKELELPALSEGFSTIAFTRSSQSDLFKVF